MSDSLFEALDLPPEAQSLQDAYWQAQHEWEALDAAYHVALADLLKRLAVVSREVARAGRLEDQVTPGQAGAVESA